MKSVNILSMSGEVNYKKDFCLRYFDSDTWQLDVHQVDVLLKDSKGEYLLYIESKDTVTSQSERREALAQVVLTNKKQEEQLTQLGLIYRNADGEDVLELIDCSDDSVMFNNDIRWQAETPSHPSKDAIDRINDRLVGRVTTFSGEDEIREAYKALKHRRKVQIGITDRNAATIYTKWKREVKFHERIDNEQDLINLFLVDILNRTTYKEVVYKEITEDTIFGPLSKQKRVRTDKNLIREGTNLLNYRLMFDGETVDGIRYKGYPVSYYYTIENAERYEAFWRKYKRPPVQEEFMKIKEHSSMLYSEQYRRDTGGEYTPSCFVALQNDVLHCHGYDMNDYIVCDPCAGVGNLENEFGKDYKQYCYLSTLVNMDVDTCRIKGFDNVIQFDYFADRQMQPKWKYRGEELDIREIAQREGRKLMVVMNPPYVRRKGYDNDMAVEFFNKVTELEPDTIVYYCKTEFFLRDTVQHFVRSGYKVVSHVFSNARTTFHLSEWSISQVVFDREKGNDFDGKLVKADRYEYNRSSHQLDFVRSYTYDNERPQLIKDIEHHIKECSTGTVLGQWANQSYCLVISNRQTHNQYITTGNLEDVLMLKGLNFNTHGKYFETSNLTYRGKISDISSELKSDAIMFSLFYKGCNFSNKEGQRNFIMPFTAEELGCGVNDLNELFTGQMNGLPFEQAGPERFNFREFLNRFEFSAEALELREAALEIFRYYHRQPKYADLHDWNDSFYDITNAIMGKNPADFQDLKNDADRRITRVKTTKGTMGFGRKNIELAVPKTELAVFIRFFDARDRLAWKINCQLVEQHLLLWERENIY